MAAAIRTQKRYDSQISPHQLTPSEVAAIGEFVTADEYRQGPAGTLAMFAQPVGKVFASASTGTDWSGKRSGGGPGNVSIPASRRSGFERRSPTRYGIFNMMQRIHLNPDSPEATRFVDCILAHLAASGQHGPSARDEMPSRKCVPHRDRSPRRFPSSQAEIEDVQVVETRSVNV